MARRVMITENMSHHETTLRVRYAETDQLGIVYHSNYFIWFEVGRAELIRSLGFSYKQMETEDDCHIVVAEAHCRYHHPARYDEVLRVRTRIPESQKRVIKFFYEVFHEPEGRLLATGETTHVICGRDGRAKSLPQKYRRLLVASPVEAAERKK
jgi:acyl-CoA thioester hydrolase